MEFELLDRSIDDVIEQLYREELSGLKTLYGKSSAELRSVEKQELNQRTIQFPLKVQDEVKAALQETKVSHVNLVWQGISERLPSFAYKYIDWDSMDDTKQAEYRREVSDSDYQKAKKGMMFPVACGCLTLGSVVLMCLLPYGNPLKKVFVFVTIVSILADGVVLVRALNSEPEASVKNVPIVRESHRSGCGEVIAAVKAENEKFLKNWCDQVREIAKEEIRA